MIRMGVVSVLILGLLSACGHSPQERAASGALIGGAIGAVVGLANEPRHDDYHESDRPRYRERGRHHRHDRGNWRRHRDHDDCCYD
ncbi:MAG: hypothetical protein ACR2RF_08685 [Geminicoccaceae bacterium]